MLIPFSQTISVLPEGSCGSSTRSFTFRLTVQGISRQRPKPTSVVLTATRVPVIPAGGPSTFDRRTRPRIASGGTVLPSGGLPPRPITPPATPQKSVFGSFGTRTILLMLRPLKKPALTGLPLPLL